MSISNDTTYEQICEEIRFTDDISFKLLGLVPFVSGSGIIAVLLKSEALMSEAIFLISLFGALLIFFLFRWELRNIQICRWLIECAAEMEKNNPNNKLGRGQFYQRSAAPLILRTPFGKAEAEKWIYSIAIFAWLTLPWLAWPSTPGKVQMPLQAVNINLIVTYIGIAVFIFILTLSSALSKIETEPKVKGE
jgi:hypothetical protein